VNMSMKKHTQSCSTINMKPKIVDCDRDLSCVEKVIVIVKQVRASAMSATYVRKSFWKRICTTD